MLVDRAAGAFIVKRLSVADLRVSAHGTGVAQRDFSVGGVSDRHLCAMCRRAESKLTNTHRAHGEDAESKGAHADHTKGKTAESDQPKGKNGEGE